MRAVKRISAVALVASLVLALGAGVALGAKPTAGELLLAGGVKPAMQKKMKTAVPGMKITTVRCTIPKGAKVLAGKCQARFTVARVSLKGVYRVQAKMTGDGILNWSTTSVACSDAKTNKPIAC